MKKLFSLFALLTVFMGANADTKEIFKWHNAENKADYVAEVGSIECLGGDVNNRLNYLHTGDKAYYTICLNGKKTDIGKGTAAGTYMYVTLSQALKEGDVISMTAYRSKGDDSKKSTAWLDFDNGATAEIGVDPEFPDIFNEGTPETITLTATTAMEGATSFNMTRKAADTNLFITSLIVTTESQPEPQGYGAVLYNGDDTPIELPNFDPTVKPAEATAANALIYVNVDLTGVEGVIPNVVYLEGASTEPGIHNVRARANELNLTDAQPLYIPTYFQADKVTYTRTFNNTEWQSMVLPIVYKGADFEGKAEVASFTGATLYDIEPDGIYDVAYILYQSEMDKNNYLEYDPVLIKAKEVGEMTITWTKDGNELVSVFSTEDNDVFAVDFKDQFGTKYAISTTFQPMAMYQTGYYGLSNGEFKYALTENAVLPAFRAYLEITPGDGPQVPICGLLVNDDPTAIKQINASKADNNYYDLSGRKVSKPTSGIYVKNGKKVLVK